MSIPVGCATYNDPAQAPDLFESAIVDGKVDFLIMNRPLCVDPGYVNKLREGRIDEIAPAPALAPASNDADQSGSVHRALPRECRQLARLRSRHARGL